MGFQLLSLFPHTSFIQNEVQSVKFSLKVMSMLAIATIVKYKELWTKCQFLLKWGLGGFLVVMHFFFVLFVLSLLSVLLSSSVMSSVSIDVLSFSSCCSSSFFSCFSALACRPLSLASFFSASFCSF